MRTTIPLVFGIVEESALTPQNLRPIASMSRLRAAGAGGDGGA
jgi:hypothetical protein